MQEIRFLKKEGDILEIMSLLQKKGAQIDGNPAKARARIKIPLGEVEFEWQFVYPKLSIDLVKKPTILPKGAIIAVLDDYLDPWLDSK